MGAVGDLGADVVGTVIHDETVLRTVLYLAVCSGVSDFGLGMWDFGPGWEKGVLRMPLEVSSFWKCCNSVVPLASGSSVWTSGTASEVPLTEEFAMFCGSSIEGITLS